MKFSSKFFVYLILTLLLILLGVFFYFAYKHYWVKENVIKVGVLFSQTGTMGVSGQPAVNATLLAIEEVNASGMLPGVRLEPVVYDGASDWNRFAYLAKKMILQDKVKVIVGCWNSAGRKAVKPVVEKYNNLLIYPTQYEATEESRNIVYLGATPNQQIIPAISWMFQNYGKKVFLVGSDYIYPHVANEIISADVNSLQGEIVGVRYLPLGTMNVDEVIQEIIAKQPDFVLNTINGDTNIAFFTRFYELNQNKKHIPIMSFSLSDAEIKQIGPEKMIEDYQAWSYFTSIDSPENATFIAAYQKKFGNTIGLSDPAVTAYAGVKLWAQGLAQGLLQSAALEPNVMRDFMLRQSVASPSGVIYVDPMNALAWRTILIGKFKPDGQTDIVWSSKNPIQPINYMDFKTKAEWDLFEYQLYTKWNESWENHN